MFVDKEYSHYFRKKEIDSGDDDDSTCEVLVENLIVDYRKREVRFV